VKLCFNILPGQKTIWHYIATAERGANLELTRSLFAQSEKTWPEFGNVRQYLPIIRDQHGKTAIDIALEDSHYNKHFIQDFFTGIKDYPIFSFGRQLEFAISVCIRRSHAGLVEFLDARLKKYDHFHKVDWQKNKLHKERKFRITATQKVTVFTVSPWS